MKDRWRRVVEHYLGCPLMYDQPRLEALLSMPEAHIDPEAFFLLFAEQDPEIEENDEVRVIPIFGSLNPDRYEWIEEQIQVGLDDPATKGIMLNIDSGGGSVNGVFELTEFIRSAREQKPIRAVANHFAASAAYAIGASTESLSLTRTAGVGSVGVIAVHVETSEMDKRLGVKFTPVYAGARKNDLSMDEPLTDSAKSELQAEVDRLWDIFIADVASSRSATLTQDAVRDTQAAMFYGERAVEVGFADRVERFSQALGRFRAEIGAGTSSQSGFDPHREDRMDAKRHADLVTAFHAKYAEGADLSELAETTGLEPEAIQAIVAGEEYSAEDAETLASALLVQEVPAEEPGAEVIPIETARSQIGEELSEARALCNLAKVPSLYADIADSIVSGELTRADVIRRIEEAQSAEPEIDGSHSGSGNGEEVPRLDRMDIFIRRANRRL